MNADDELVEKMARAIADYELPVGPNWQDRWVEYVGTAHAALAAARPVIRAQALEEAAEMVAAMPRTYDKVKEDHDVLGMKGTWTFTLNNGPAECAAAIRALKEKE